MEEQLGVNLFERSGKSLILTEEGKVLYDNALNILNQLDDTISKVKETSEGIRGLIRIGCVNACYYHLPKNIIDFKQKYPNVRFLIKDGTNHNQEHFLKNRDVEFTILPFPIEIDNINIIKLPTDPFVVIMSNKWLSNRASNIITMEEIKEMPLILLERKKGICHYSVVVEEFRKHGVYKPNIVCECSDPNLLLSLISLGMGISLVPKSLIKNNYTLFDIKILEIVDSTLSLDSAIIWLKDRELPKTSKRFLDFLETTYGAKL